MKGQLDHIRELHALRSQMEAEPWIHFRNRLISALANKRRELGVSQNDMAKILGTAGSGITRFESMAITKKGKPVTPPNPTLKSIVTYAAALGYGIDFTLVPLEEHLE